MFFITNELETNTINKLLEELDIPLEKGFYSNRSIYRANRIIIEDSDIPEASFDTTLNRVLSDLDNYACPSSFYGSV